jgi:integrase
MLTDTGVKALRARDKPYKQSDAAGLYLLITPAGGRLWRLNYMRAGKQKTAALGAYPAVSLADARRARDAAKAQLRAGQDPGEVVKAEKVEARAAVTTFKDVAGEWFEKKMIAEGKADNTIRKTEWLLEILYDGIGAKPIASIEAPELLDVLRRVEAQGNHEACKRARSTASMIFRFGIAIGACKRDPAADLKGALTTGKSRPRSAIVEPVEVGKLMRAIAGYKRPREKLALQFLALTMVRPGEACGAEWSEIAGDIWSIPAPKMKMRDDFRVPLSRQALAVLAEARGMAGNSRFVFPSLRKRNVSLAPRVLNKSLRELGFDGDEISAHGFRSTASTLLNESGKSPDAIELCLAHAPRGVRGLYNRSKLWPERVAIMQWLADHLDELRGHGEVVKLPKRSKVDAR